MARTFTLIVALIALGSGAATAQAPPPRVYLPNTADEDWSFLKDKSKRIDSWDPVKYVPLGSEDRYLTLSGEIRFRPEGLRMRGVGERPTTTDNYLLQRYLFGADVHLGKRVRVFGEVQSGIINGQLRSPRPTDLNQLDLHQAFVEVRQPIGGGRFDVVIGRQELAIGSTRLISASPGLNVKRSFDGAQMTYRAKTWVVTGAAARLVTASSGVFDDTPDPGQDFWGVAAGWRSSRASLGELGLYYLGVDRHRSVYAQGIGPELRHTIGSRWRAAVKGIDTNYDGLLQWGRFRGDAPVRAWAFATETGYRFASKRWRPRVSVRADIASGDHDLADPGLQSFNPLFPGNSYSGAVGLLGPTNLTDLNAALTMSLRRNLILSVEAPSYWRTSTGDGIYSTDQRLIVPPTAGSGHYVGSNPGIVVIYQATRHLQIQGVVTRFLSGGFLDKTFVANGFGFYSATALYRF